MAAVPSRTQKISQLVGKCYFMAVHRLDATRVYFLLTSVVKTVGDPPRNSRVCQGRRSKGPVSM